MEITVHDNPSQSRFELLVDGELAGIEAYRLDEPQGLIELLHTEVFESHAGKGLARVFVQRLLEEARRRNLGVLPYCKYVRKFIAEHPEYLDLVPANRRAEFDL